MRLALPLLLLLAGCGGSGPAPTAAPSPSPSVPRVEVTVTRGGAVQVRVQAEVADDDAERAVGLMRRTEVPPGTGMVFLYPAPVDAQFYMYDVPVPLTAVFARGGRVVGVVEMPPCEEQDPMACPTYGPGTSFDTVLETAPGTVEGRVRVGDTLAVAGGGAG